MVAQNTLRTCEGYQVLLWKIKFSIWDCCRWNKCLKQVKSPKKWSLVRIVSEQPSNVSTMLWTIESLLSLSLSPILSPSHPPSLLLQERTYQINTDASYIYFSQNSNDEIRMKDSQTWIYSRGTLTIENTLWWRID